MKVIIVGGVAGGASAAARLRRLDEKAKITIYERSGYISYANCGLPYYIGGVIAEKERLTLQTPESFYKRFRVDVKTRHEVTAIDPAKKTVTVKNRVSGEEFTDKYDKLLLSTGARPIRPCVPGVDEKNIFTIRTVEDTLCIERYIKEKGAASAVIVGGGFVGLEAAENLRRLGLDVTVVEASGQVLPSLDFDMAAQVQASLRKNGLKLMLESSVASFKRVGSRIITSLSGGENVSSDLVVLAAGVAPDSALAAKAGLKLGAKGSIAVNSRMETSAPDIYAVGDAVEVTDFVTGESRLIPLAGPANKQGRIAADNMAGGNSEYRGTQGSSVIKLFDMTAASTGINERRAKALGIAYEKVVLSPISHASYYPGGKVMTMKVLFEKGTERLLGAQIVGYEGVDKRIDVIATALRAGIKAGELSELELSYAPPYSSAKDPVNMAGFIIENVASGKVKQFHYDDLASLPRDGSVFLLDSRTPSEFSKGHVEGFVNIPVDELRERINEIPAGKPVYIMCQTGLRSYIACRILSGLGFDCYNFSGGYRFYSIVNGENPVSRESFPCGKEK